MGSIAVLLRASNREWVVELSMLVLFAVTLLSVNLRALTLVEGTVPEDQVVAYLEFVLRH